MQKEWFHFEWFCCRRSPRWMRRSGQDSWDGPDVKIGTRAVLGLMLVPEVQHQTNVHLWLMPSFHRHQIETHKIDNLSVDIDQLIDNFDKIPPYSWSASSKTPVCWLSLRPDGKLTRSITYHSIDIDQLIDNSGNIPPYLWSAFEKPCLPIYGSIWQGSQNR